MRRRIAVIAVVLVSGLFAACSELAAPQPHSEDCRSGYTGSDGRFICTDPG